MIATARKEIEPSDVIAADNIEVRPEPRAWLASAQHLRAPRPHRFTRVVVAIISSIGGCRIFIHDCACSSPAQITSHADVVEDVPLPL